MLPSESSQPQIALLRAISTCLNAQSEGKSYIFITSAKQVEGKSIGTDFLVIDCLRWELLHFREFYILLLLHWQEVKGNLSSGTQQNKFNPSVFYQNRVFSIRNMFVFRQICFSRCIFLVTGSAPLVELYGVTLLCSYTPHDAIPLFYIHLFFLVCDGVLPECLVPFGRFSGLILFFAFFNSIVYVFMLDFVNSMI